MLIICIIIVIVIFVIFFLFFRQLYSSNYIVVGNKQKEHFVDKLMIVAHPDDELIFGGKQLIEEKGWKIISVTNGTKNSNDIFKVGTENIRKKEFINVMNSLGHCYEMWDYEDNYLNNNWNESLLLEQLQKTINEKNYKKIVTHNLQGEYGHRQHKKISELVHKLKPKNLYVFDINDSEINTHIKELYKLIELYGTQKKIIQKHQKYLVHQCIRKVE